ncbi:MAG: alkaline phosphatase family protein, partial [Nitrospira sp.]|nr:alkaline phosphatase family protein [Nitrospira sp.]
MEIRIQNGELKLLVIGLDGATFDVIQPMIAAGELPNLAALVDKGTSGYLESTVPAFSPPAWASFMTGMNPGRHGIFGFVNYDPSSYAHLDSKPVTARSLAGHTFFDILSQAGYRLAVITVPITYPAWAINGYMVAGEPCPDTETGLAYPEDFAAALPHRYAFLSTFWSKPNANIISGLFGMMERRAALALQLIDEKELDAMVVVFGAIDRAQHNFWRYYDPAFGARLNLPREADYDTVIPQIYSRADAAIGRLLSRVGEEATVFIVSDHGGGPAAMRYLHTNAWLQQQGLLSVRQSRDTVVGNLRRAVMAVRRGLGAPLENRLRGLLPNRVIEQGRALVRNVAHIDWPATQAYRFPMYPPAEGIVINVAGRQRQGIVQRGGEYEQVREQILEQSRQLIDPATRQPVVVRAYKREELYHGPHAERAPDIVLVLAEDYTGGANVQPPLTTTVDPSLLSKVNGEHRIQGVLLACGPIIRQDVWVQNARLVDIAPTILYALGEPVPEEMDGVVLGDLFSPFYREAHPVKYCDEGTARDIGVAESGLTP